MTRIHPKRFVHVAYRTRRFEEMLKWYQIVFDAEIKQQNPAIAFLTYDDEHHRFAIINLDVVKPEDGDKDKHGLVGIDHVAYTYATIDDLLDNYQHLKEHGIMPYWCVHHGVTASMYFADPDGNQMEFQVDCFETPEESLAFMESAAFEANPVGVEYDPEEWLAKRKAGEPASSFLKIPKGQPSPIRGTLEG